MNKTNNYHTTVRLDILKVILDCTTPSNLAKIHAKDTAPRTHTTLTKAQAGDARENHDRWQAYKTGKPYVLHIQNRTSDHSFRVQAYGKNIFQAVRRYYRGLDDKCNWTWQCTKVIKVFECSNESSCKEGKRLI
jgi:hypothetical protein